MISKDYLPIILTLYSFIDNESNLSPFNTHNDVITTITSSHPNTNTDGYKEKNKGKDTPTSPHVDWSMGIQSDCNIKDLLDYILLHSVLSESCIEGEKQCYDLCIAHICVVICLFSYNYDVLLLLPLLLLLDQHIEIVTVSIDSVSSSLQQNRESDKTVTLPSKKRKLDHTAHKEKGSAVAGKQENLESRPDGVEESGHANSRRDNRYKSGVIYFSQFYSGMRDYAVENSFQSFVTIGIARIYQVRIGVV